VSRGGRDLRLVSGDYTADVTTVGAGLRALQYRGRDLVLPYPATDVRPLSRGAVLAPWPNRIADGRYRFGGADHQVPLNEPDRRNALHGLVSWERFEVSAESSAAVTLTHRLVPQPGYPFDLDLTVQHRLDGHGLLTTVTARNVGDTTAPYGVAPHPYLRAGEGTVDDWALQVPADRVLQVTPDRLLPTALAGVDEAGLDFREPRRPAGTRIDHAYTALTADPDGLARVRVHDPTHGDVVCEWDPALLPWVQVHTADLPDPESSRRGMAVEPMTCPPNAFNSGTDLVVLEPGAEHSAWWAIRATG
jgi:aldose 1-epimerase